MEDEIKSKFDSLRGMIGNTPLLEIECEYKGTIRHVYAKAEMYNFSGSLKDRVALYVCEKAYEEGRLKKGDVICEATSGNTGIAFAAVGTALGHHVVIYIPDSMSIERIKLMKAYGAEVRLVSHEQGDFVGSVKLSEEYAKTSNVFLPKQFTNIHNSDAHYLSTGPELVTQLNKFGLTCDAIVAGVGTGGTVMGVGRAIKKDNSNAKIFPLEPTTSPALASATNNKPAGYYAGCHRIQGIGDGFVPAIVNLEELDDILQVDDGDAIVMSKMIAKELGVGVGISSGANLIGAILAQEKLNNPNAVVATVFADSNMKYLSTDYANEHRMHDDYISKDIKLIKIRSIR